MVLSARQQQAGQFVARLIGVFDDPVDLFPTPLGVGVLHGWQLCPGGVLSIFYHPLHSLEGDATAMPGGDTTQYS